MNNWEPIFRELANGLLATADVKPNFSNSAFFDAVIIFQTAFSDKLFEKNPEHAEQAGAELRAYILKYTGIDTFEIS